MKIIRITLDVLCLLAFAAAISLYGAHEYTRMGLSLSLLFLLSAFRMLLSSRFKRFAFTVMILSAVSVSLSFPEYFISVAGFKLSKCIVPLLQIIMLGVGCNMKWEDLARAAKMYKAVTVGVICQFLIMPSVGFTIAKLGGFPPEIAAGIVLVGCMPGGMASNVMSYIAKANVGLSVTMTTISTLLAPVLTPLLMQFWGGEFIHIDFLSMLIDIVNMVFIPVGIGISINYFLGKYRFVARLQSVMPVVSMLGIAFIIVIVTSAGRDSLLSVGILLVVAMFMHMTVGATLGYLIARLFRLGEQECRTVSIEVGMQNGGLASGFAFQMGKIATVGLAAAVNGPIMNTTFSIIATWWSKKSFTQKSVK